MKAREELTALRNLQSSDLDEADPSRFKIQFANEMDKPLQVSLRKLGEEKKSKKTGGEQRTWNFIQGR